MKKALLLSLALIAVVPVAVQGQEAESISLVNRLLQSRTCEIHSTALLLTCTFDLPGLVFSVYAMEADENESTIRLRELLPDERWRAVLSMNYLSVAAGRGVACIDRRTAGVRPSFIWSQCELESNHSLSPTPPESGPSPTTPVPPA